MVKRMRGKNRVSAQAQRAADAMRVASGGARPIFISHASRVADVFAVAEGLPAGSIVICRDYDHPDRFGFAQRLRQTTWSRRQILLVAGDVALARAVQADGVHLPEYQLSRPKPAGFRFVTAACHTRMALRRAADLKVDLALVSPVFPTRSHTGARTLGVHRFSRLIAGAGIPVAALGGVTPATAKKLRPLRLAGVAAIDGFL